jgi:hypothetical protein
MNVRMARPSRTEQALPRTASAVLVIAGEDTEWVTMW